MPLYNVHPHFTIRRATTYIIARPLVRQSHFQPLDQRASLQKTQQLNLLSTIGGAYCYILGTITPTKNSSVIICQTRESNPTPLVRQSQLRPLDQRGSQCF
ncbi:hypothetical protein SFRURICE_020121, partial [Spodoptera frugiperda]